MMCDVKVRYKTNIEKKSFSPEPYSFLYPTVHVTLHIQPGGLEPADGALVTVQSDMSLQIVIPRFCVLPAICQC